MNGRRTPLSLSPDEFRKLGYALVDRIAGHLRTLPSRPVTAAPTVGEVRRMLRAGDPLPESGGDPDALLREAANLLLNHSLFNGHPRFWGYITSSPAPIGILADLLASAANPNCGAWTLAPVATEIEVQTVRWIADFMGYPSGAPGRCGGLLVSGGNMANFVCFLAARLARMGPAIREKGLPREGGLWRIYGSAGTHTWIQKAADLFGLGTDSIRWIPVGKDQRLDTAALRDQLNRDAGQGDRPLMIVGTAGSVATGTVDPLFELAALSREYGAWFHVDGAYGGLAAQVPGVPADLAGLAEADSVAVDPHKWLYAPLEAGCALVRDPEHLRAAFSYHPAYYHFDEEAVNYFDLGPQNSRGFRALKVWLALKQAGRSGYTRMIAEDIELARHLDSCVRAEQELEALGCGLSITTFRYLPPNAADREQEYVNRLNKEIQGRIEKSGEAFVSNAVIEGVYALRACVVNFNTSRADVEALPEIVTRIGRQAHADLRGGGEPTGKRER